MTDVTEGLKPTGAMIEAGARAFQRCHAGSCYPESMPFEADDAAVAIYLAMHSASPTPALTEADLEPFADYHGDLPDYDHPLRPVYESGVQYAVELLAKVLKVENWELCDGTEEFDGDLGGTLLNIVSATWPQDEHGDWIDMRDPQIRASASPTPAAEEFEAVIYPIALDVLSNGPSKGPVTNANIIGERAAAAIAAMSPTPASMVTEEEVARAICWAFTQETDDCSSTCLKAGRCMAEEVDASFKRDARAAILAMSSMTEGVVEALQLARAALADEVVGTIYQDDPAWYAKVDAAVAAIDAALRINRENSHD